MLKILQASLQQYMNREVPDVQARFRKGRGTRDQIANMHWIIKKARQFQKNIYCFTDNAIAFDCVNHNSGKFLKETGIPDHLTCTICMQIKTEQSELDMEQQQTGSKSGKEYIKVAYRHPAYLTYIQSTSCEMPGWMKHKLEQRELSITLDTHIIPPLWQKARGTEEPLNESERGE